MNGIILIDKPLGKTSHDMVYFVRRLTGIKKVGHTGTLDPDASGVLPVCVGKATKVCDMLTASDKSYRATLVLGKTTDTQDASGKVLTEQTVSTTEEEILKAAEKFVGEIEQIPPMFSAIKKDGKKLYELARRGITVEREPRRVTIHSINVTSADIESNRIDIDVHCSKGTYIRTLCEDIGNALGCGAYMSALRRTKSGGFDISECYTPEKLAEMRERGRLADAFISIDKIFEAYESVVLDDFLAAKVKNGIRIRRGGLHCGELYRIYDKNGELLAVSRYNGAELVMEKSFWS